MAQVSGELVSAVREGLAALADPAKAASMRAYMKSEQPFRGVQSAGVKAVCRTAFAEYPPTDRAGWEATVRALWDEAAHREERYAAIALTGHRAARAWQDPGTVPLYDHLIVTGAWWDFVDELAIHRVGPLLRCHPSTLGPLLRRWARDADRWRRRTAIIAQNSAGEDLDEDLLRDCIEPNLLHPASEVGRDFFVRKAIGWALRQHARVDPEWVRAYVDELGDRLAPLSRREATKHL